MSGTIIITGANSSLAIPMVEHILSRYPGYHLILTVRNPSGDTDVNTKRLRAVVEKHSDVADKISIRALDLANLSVVHAFSEGLAAEIAAGTLPRVAAIVCNAYYWNLVDVPVLTRDGLETALQVNHVAHAALVLRLLTATTFASGGRVVFLGTNATDPGANSFEKYPPVLPNDLDDLARVPEHVESSDRAGTGFYRYALSKLAATMFSYALNRRLEKDPDLNTVTAVTINPGNLADSRALQTNTPRALAISQTLLLKPLRPLLAFADPTIRTAAAAGADVAELATGHAHSGARGFFTLLKESKSSDESLKVDRQEEVWRKTLAWAKVDPKNEEWK
ncbi:hypothetical protein P885DRAFT_45412 [Corynascus similis CBS 632.67]